MSYDHPIGVFDSGVGGLTVFQEILKQLPRERVVYFGDTGHVPYGGRSPEELIRFADSITAFLIEQGVKLILDACNSTSSVALPYLQARYEIPIIGVVEAGVKMALQVTRNGKIGIIATEATIKSGVHRRLILEREPKAEVFGQACPLFVPLVEAGNVDGPETRRVAAEYLFPLKQAGVDTLIFGCTHYPYLAPVVQEIMGKEVALVDPAVETVRQAKEILIRMNKLSEGIKPGFNHTFYVSGSPEQFKRVARQLTGLGLIEEVKQVILD
ncbi:glutamate racemase [Calderihabitans maritimus]|uniref:Glutamate racemase n=1 Tax=Calderihabitans maritimus TaxID=1246530 RepID=A0A1Z5HP13_9FIRM|nr:glutamate racemase [Calderihabitans maritimus]GAW91272.1 glutamate racemase [Calderihabitans maritimus]